MLAPSEVMVDAPAVLAPADKKWTAGDKGVAMPSGLLQQVATDNAGAEAFLLMARARHF